MLNDLEENRRKADALYGSDISPRLFYTGATEPEIGHCTSLPGFLKVKNAVYIN